jgi:hypothetical protein
MRHRNAHSSGDRSPPQQQKIPAVTIVNVSVDRGWLCIRTPGVVLGRYALGMMQSPLDQVYESCEILSATVPRTVTDEPLDGFGSYSSFKAWLLLPPTNSMGLVGCIVAMAP